MLRAMLADRFKLAVQFEKREQPVYDLVLARSDGRLGRGLQPGSNVDCEARAATQRAAAEAARAAGTPPLAPLRPDMTGPMPLCSFRIVGARMDGEAPIASLAFMPSKAERDTLVVDRLERPTEN